MPSREAGISGSVVLPYYSNSDDINSAERQDWRRAARFGSPVDLFRLFHCRFSSLQYFTCNPLAPYFSRACSCAVLLVCLPTRTGCIFPERREHETDERSGHGLHEVHSRSHKGSQDKPEVFFSRRHCELLWEIIQHHNTLLAACGDVLLKLPYRSE